MIRERVPTSTCPGCGNRLDAASHTHATPKPDDVSVCAYCGALAVFTAELTLRPVKLDELTKLDPKDRARIRRMQDHIRATRPS